MYTQFYQSSFLSRLLFSADVRMMQCNRCGTEVSRNDNLNRHKKTCKGSGIHTISPRVIVPAVLPGDRSGSSRRPLFKRQDLSDGKTLAEHAAGRKSLKRMIEEADDDNAEREVADSEEMDSDVSMDEGDADEMLWDGLVIACNNTGSNIFGVLQVYMDLYNKRETDDLYQEILEDVKKAEMTMTLADALDHAIEKNKDSITESVVSCRRDDDDGLNLWCTMAQRDVKPRCKWFTGDECACNECKGTSLLKKVRHFAEIFHAMENDDVVQKIDEVVDERSEDMDRDEAIKQAIEEYKEDIQEKYQEARNRLKRCNWDENHRKHVTFQWKE